MASFINITLGYYEGERIDPLDQVVPIRPLPLSTWDGKQWIAPDPAIVAALSDTQAIAYFANGDKSKQFLLTLLYMTDQRLRILEAKPAITRVQFLAGVKQIYKDT